MNAFRQRSYYYSSKGRRWWFVVCCLSLLLCSVVLAQDDHRDRFWKHIAKQQAGLVDLYGIERFSQMQQCMNEKLQSVVGWKEEENLKDPPPKNRTVIHTVQSNDSPTKNHTILVQLSNVLEEKEADALFVLSDCTLHIFHQQLHEIRSFFGNGGNTVVFLNTLLQLFLPSLAKRVYEIANVAYDATRIGRICNIPIEYRLSSYPTTTTTTIHHPISVDCAPPNTYPIPKPTVNWTNTMTMAVCIPF